MSDITLILNAAQQGDSKAAEQLLPLVYDELRRLAAWRLANERPGQTLQATALVHEAYLRLVGNEDARWEGRRHFFGAAAEAMRRILVDNARRKKRLKHGGLLERVDVEDVDIASPIPDDELLAVDDHCPFLRSQFCNLRAAHSGASVCKGVEHGSVPAAKRPSQIVNTIY